MTEPANNGEIKIEKKIPIPSGRGPYGKYPWSQMEIGDSFLIPGKKVSLVSSTMASAGRRLNKKFTARTVEGGVRVWRIA